MLLDDGIGHGRLKLLSQCLNLMIGHGDDTFEGSVIVAKRMEFS